MMHRKLLPWCSIALVLFGVLFYWPLGALGIILAAFSEHFTLALILGVSLDIIYGQPPVRLHAFLLPFMLLAIVTILLRVSSSRYIRRQGRGEVF